MSIVNREESCKVWEEMNDCKDCNNVYGIKFDSVKCKYNAGLRAAVVSSLTGNSCGGDNCREWLITVIYESPV